MYFCLLKTKPIFFKEGKSNFLIKLGQRLPKPFSQLHVKNSRFFLSYFLKKDDWPKAYAGPSLPTLPYMKAVAKFNSIRLLPILCFCCLPIWIKKINETKKLSDY